MAIVDTELFIARRLAGRVPGRKHNVMVRIASLTVAVSVAVMIISMAVIRGFREEITGKLIGFGAHVQVVNMDGNSSMESTPINRNPALLENISRINDFSGAHAYATKGGILKTADAMQGVLLKGVEKDYDWDFFRSNLTEGELPRITDSVRTKDVLISKSLSAAMGLETGSRAEILFIQEGRAPRRDLFKVSGIYDSGFEEFDDMLLVTDIRNVQRLNGWGSEQITGYEVTALSSDRSEEFAEEVFDAVVKTEHTDKQVLMALSIRDRYPNLFDWLTAHNVNAAVIIIIMLLVAFFNMVSALLILVLERTSMIGVLKALGMTDWAIQKIFVIRSSFIVLKGMLWGNIAGISICLLQRYTHLVKLDQSGYFISEVPIDLGWWLITLNAVSFVVLIALLTIPTMIVSRIKPEKTIRYQ